MKIQILALLVFVNSIAFAATPAGKKTVTTTTTVRTESTGDSDSGSADNSRLAAGFELLGSALLYSAYGTFRIIPMLAANVGVSYIGLGSGSGTSSTSSSTLMVPLSISLLVGKGNHNFEFLAGGLLAFSGASSGGTGFSQSLGGTTFFPQFGLGYRLWPTEGGFFLRALMYGTIATGPASGFFPWPGLTLGFAF